MKRLIFSSQTGVLINYKPFGLYKCYVGTNKSKPDDFSLLTRLNT